MFHLLCKIPNRIGLAFSGGIDSLAVAHFLKKGKKDITLLHFNHGCKYSDTIQAQCGAIAEELGLPIVYGQLSGEKPKGQSLEDFWRRSRYRFLREYSRLHNTKFICAHHLGDATSGWVWSSLHGEGKLIPIEDAELIRPFLITKKDEFIKYCMENNLIAVDDPYNREEHLRRNYINANMMHHVYFVNPGFDKVIRKKYLKLLRE